jgi:hypothetical protein
MAELKIVTVNFEVPGGLVECLSFTSDRSLLDADIIVFKPSLPNFLSFDQFQGKKLLNESNSFFTVEAIKHWRAELHQAVQSGKTVIVYLVKPEQVFVYTGKKKYSGTGRNRQTTNIVDLLSSYDALPISLENLVPKGGECILPASDLKYITTYWSKSGNLTKYEIYFEGNFTDVLLKTRTGDKIVGASIRNKNGGTLLLLPPLDLDEIKLIRYNKDKESVWTKEAFRIGHQLLEGIINIDKALKSDRDITPPPVWTKASEWRLPNESKIESDITAVTDEIKKLRDKKTELLTQLSAESSLRRLLYEKGSELESAVLECLRLMGFDAQPFKDPDSEFDAVFICAEGRFLGEVEGKDNRAINIDKLDQLERNLQEDFAKENVSEYAKGVLFGNAYRLLPPNERSVFFTEKCIKGAERLKVALVRTPDMFSIARYLKETQDTNYAKQCRQAILVTKGRVVQFPRLPIEESSSIKVAEARVETTTK